MISPTEAEAAIRASVPILPVMPLPLMALTGATLREAIVASRDQPPFDRVMMDGIAFAMSTFEAGCRRFRVVGTQAAGAPPIRLGNPQDCIEVMTGAMLPAGCDCVVPFEQVRVHDGVATLLEDVAPRYRLNIHPRGLDTRQGAALLQPGTRLGPAEVAVIAANGRTHAQASQPARIMVISTGDELVEPGEELRDWQIHRSNVYALLTALRQRGYGPLAQDHLPDDLPILRRRLREHLDTHDVLILSGGVSMGRYDYIPQVLQELGVSVVFHKIAQRPGRPMWFGIGAGGKTVYALPGNPVSTLVCLARYVYTGLDAAAGMRVAPPETVLLGEDVEARPKMSVFVPVKLQTEDGGLRMAFPRYTQGSGDFVSLLGSDGIVELSPAQSVRRGTPVAWYPW